MLDIVEEIDLETIIELGGEPQCEFDADSHALWCKITAVALFKWTCDNGTRLACADISTQVIVLLTAQDPHRVCKKCDRAVHLCWKVTPL